MTRDFCDDVIAHVHIAMTMKIRLIVQPYEPPMAESAEMIKLEIDTAILPDPSSL